MQGRIEKKISTESKIQIKIKDMPEYVKRFYYFLNQKSHTKKETYIGNVIRFLNYVSNNNINSLTIDKIKTIDGFVIEQYMESINFYNKKGKIKEMSNATKAINYASINSFFVFLCSNDYINRNPFDNKRIQRPKLEENDVTFLTPEEVKEIEERILHGYGSEMSKSKQSNWKYRDYLLFRIPVVTGLRIEALIEINLEDIDLINKTIKVTEKGNITKLIYIDDITRDYIIKWEMQRDYFIDDDNDCRALFISNQLTRITKRAVEKIIKKYADGINGKHITPHKLRSTCGTNLYQAKKDIYLVASVLGHKSTEPTQRYTKVFDTDKKDAINTLASIYA